MCSQVPKRQSATSILSTLKESRILRRQRCTCSSNLTMMLYCHHYVVILSILLFLHLFGEDNSVLAHPITTVDAITTPSIIQPRIIGGTDVAAGTFPFLVSLLGQFGGHSCGGSLIAPDIVLSAAHCINLMGAHVGRHNRGDENDDYEEFSFLQEIRHPGYAERNFQYDFMIIQLDGQSTKPAVTLNQDEELPTPGIDKGVKVIGFGVTEYNSDGSYGVPATILQQTDLTAISNAECDQSKDPDSQDPEYQNGYQNLIRPEMLCAKGDNVDSCLGDSGGPLLLPTATGTELRYIQVGVTSWGFGCNSPKFPGVYSRVSNQYEWIRSTVCQISAAPPNDFDCDLQPLPPAQDVTVTLTVTFDGFPSELGWVLVDETNFGMYVADVSPEDNGVYGPQSTVTFSYTVKEGSTYFFYMYDTNADGLCCPVAGSYELVIGTAEAPIQVVLSGGGDFGTEQAATFVVPSLNDTDVTMSPTFLTPAPSSAVSGNDVSTMPSPTGMPTTAPAAIIQSVKPTTADDGTRVSGLPTFFPTNEKVDPTMTSPPTYTTPPPLPPVAPPTEITTLTPTSAIITTMTPTSTVPITTVAPTATVTTATPTVFPTVTAPTATPTIFPTATVTKATMVPTGTEITSSMVPTVVVNTTEFPTALPTKAPSSSPTAQPTTSQHPSSFPSRVPSNEPRSVSTARPTIGDESAENKVVTLDPSPSNKSAVCGNGTNTDDKDCADHVHLVGSNAATLSIGFELLIVVVATCIVAISSSTT